MAGAESEAEILARIRDYGVIDDCRSMALMSKALRHMSTETTEKWYGRVRSESAFSQMRQAVEKSNLAV